MDPETSGRLLSFVPGTGDALPLSSTQLPPTKACSSLADSEVSGVAIGGRSPVHPKVATGVDLLPAALDAHAAPFAPCVMAGGDDSRRSLPRPQCPDDVGEPGGGGEFKTGRNPVQETGGAEAGEGRRTGTALATGRDGASASSPSEYRASLCSSSSSSAATWSRKDLSISVRTAYDLPISSPFDPPVYLLIKFESGSFCVRLESSLYSQIQSVMYVPLQVNRFHKSI